MASLFEQLAELDRLVHEPARLAILTALSACQDADATFLQRLTGLSWGNLGSHLAKLREAGLVEVDKGYAGTTPRTRVWLTADGRARIDTHWDQLHRLHDDARRWRPDQAASSAGTTTH
jgi:DNA-binding transcriptional ArsR family regulator